MESDPSRQGAVEEAGEKSEEWSASPVGRGGSSVPGVGTWCKQEARRCGFVALVITHRCCCQTAIFWPCKATVTCHTAQKGPLNPSGPPGASGTPLDLSWGGCTECVQAQAIALSQQGSPFCALKTRTWRKGKPWPVLLWEGQSPRSKLPYFRVIPWDQTEEWRCQSEVRSGSRDVALT